MIMKKLLLTLLAALAALVLLPAPAVAQYDSGDSAEASASTYQRTEPWSPEVVELMKTLAVQDNGRIKPLDTLAGLRMFMLNGKRTLKLENGEKLGPTEWLLDVLFYPEQARSYACVRIENDAILTLLGLEAKKKRDWYSYDQLLPARTKIAREFGRVGEKRQASATLTLIDKQVEKLEIDLRRFEGLLSLLDPLRAELPTNATPELRAVFGDEPVRGAGHILAKLDEFRSIRQAGLVNADGNYEATTAILEAISRSLASSRFGVNMFPPVTGEAADNMRAMGYQALDEEEWWNLGDVVAVAMQIDIPDQTELLMGLQEMTDAGQDGAALLAGLRHLHGKAEALSTARGEYKHIEREVAHYEQAPFLKALVFFVIAFLVMLISFLAPILSQLRWGGLVLTLVGLGYLTNGIVMRSIIRHRPPVVTLYDTILFVTAVIVLVALASELLLRNRVSLSMAALIGTVGMFVAGNYELREVASAGDTMASVVAVLDTNYYLAIHVTTISMGYAGGLLAGALGITWIVGQLLGLGRRWKDGFKTLIRSIYGVVAFALLFSVFGTIMGGVWANDSWGRFWGWDPKENGALLICLWMLLVVHLRLGGYIRDRGLATMATLGAGIVSFSWWHVNMLEIGLHSYGKIDGIYDKLIVTYITLLGLAALSVIDHFIKNGRTPASR
jgi:ABC-type transport system involved in cytochrome c biogenesis permease subunit